MDISTKELSNKIKEILKDADLEKITSKLVRWELEKHFNTTLTVRRDEIDKIIMSTLNPSKDSSSDSDLSSIDDSDPSETEPRRRQKVTKRQPREAKSRPPKSTAKASRPAKQLSDEELARQLQASENGMRVRQRVNMSVLPWYARRGPKKRSADESGEESAAKKKKKPARLCVLSEPLAQLMGATQMSRGDVVKELWRIAKERDLFDPENRQYIICDAEFERIFNRRRLRMFTIMKHMNSIMKDIDAIV